MIIKTVYKWGWEQAGIERLIEQGSDHQSGRRPPWQPYKWPSPKALSNCVRMKLNRIGWGEGKGREKL